MNRLIRAAAVVATTVALTAFGGQSAFAATPANTTAHPVTNIVHPDTTLTSTGWANGPAGRHSFEVTGGTSVTGSCGIITCTDTFKNSHADAYWWGVTPRNAKKINASMKWWITGVNITFSLPPGAAFHPISGGVMYKPGAISNNWHQGLRYAAGVALKANIIFSDHYTDQADILVGTTWYHVQGN